jgi:anti-anti-sigma factor
LTTSEAIGEETQMRSVVQTEGVAETGVAAVAGDGRLELTLAGPITAGTVARLRQALRRCVEWPGADVLVDMRRVTVLDVTGIAALLDGRRVIDRGGKRTMTLHVNPVVRRALRESGTIGVFRVRDGM